MLRRWFGWARAPGGVDFFRHWLFGLYGDFDRNDRVDTGDLALYVDYWLLAEAAEADYTEDGVVNGYEFAFFAGNWLQSSAEIKSRRAPAEGPAPSGIMTSFSE